MPEDLSKRPDLLIVSDTAVYIDDQGKYLAYEPVVREIEHFAHLFSSITWIAFHYPLNHSVRNIREVSKVDIKYVLLPAVGVTEFIISVKNHPGVFQIDFPDP